ncbi:roadblock/LC7 domain-containing protein [Aestuariibaculum marinum]|uniref:Roadblock/LC7 domain-containing protein n=1 Tax=Aestuariibaculum marinum TaxID=2683592 RepID=A0A8J6U3L9_9FLAO|nr:roadblock/LC7 domain-containing protein [Aestuariibaculum marinum]MBD0823287.1 roadblock/LC7 domain-containing protein [Aestuariibaculum marinum]
MPKPIDLDALIEDIDVECGFIFDSDGVLEESMYLDLSENFAAMSSMITTMCREIAEDFELGEIDNIILNAQSGLFVVKKVEEDRYLGVVTYDSSKLALIHRRLQSLFQETEA